MPLRDQLFVLGWGRGHTLALLEWRTLDGPLEGRVRVWDLVEDRIVWEVSFPSRSDQDAPSWWQEHEAEVVPALSRAGIEPSNWQLGVFPLILDNEYYTVVLRTHRTGEWIDRWDLLAHSTGRGLKVVQSVEGAWRWASLLGFLASPYENRVAAVVVVQPAGWEGARQPLRFVVTGLSLKAGFPSP